MFFLGDRGGGLAKDALSDTVGMVKWGKLLSNSLILFMVFDMALSGLALGRYSARQDEKTAVSQTVSGEEGGLNGWLDRHFPDERMKRIYPNAKFVD